MPAAILITFHIEEKFGFNKHTAATFIGDTVKGLLVNLVLGAILNLGMIYTVTWAGPSAWFYLWVFITVFCTCHEYVISNSMCAVVQYVYADGRRGIKRWY